MDLKISIWRIVSHMKVKSDPTVYKISSLSKSLYDTEYTNFRFEHKFNKKSKNFLFHILTLETIMETVYFLGLFTFSLFTCLLFLPIN